MSTYILLILFLDSESSLDKPGLESSPPMHNEHTTFALHEQGASLYPEGRLVDVKCILTS